MDKKLISEIEKIRKYMNLPINEEKDRKHEYGCVMIYLKFPEIKELHKEIDEEDIYIDDEDDSFGLEKDPHTTLLFGLHDEVTTEDVKKVVNEFKFDECKVYNVSLFESEKYDVLKFDVSGDNLTKCNKSLAKFPHTNDFPDYHPHLTIGYIKPGKGKKYVKKFKNNEFSLEPNHIVYSKPDGTKDNIKLKK